MRSGFVTLDVCGKPQKSWQVQSFTDAFSIPYNFVHEGHKFSLRKKIDEEDEETENLDLDIDGVPYFKNPFVSSDFGKS